MIPFDLHYQWPSAAYLILFIFPALFCLWILFAYRQKISFVKEMILKRSSAIFWTKAAVFAGVIAFCAIALMQPVGNGHYPEGVIPMNKPQSLENIPLKLKRKAHDIIFLIDASASMAVKDTRLQKSRLDYTKIIADEIMATLTGETVALYAFTSDVSQLAPLTLDYLFTRLMIKEIQFNEGGTPGTDIGNLLREIRSKYFSEKIPTSRLKTFILLSDGEDTTLEFYPEGMKNEGLRDLAKYLDDAAQNRIRFYTVGMGSASGGVIPEVLEQGQPVVSHLKADLLKLLANKGRGQYYESNLYTPAQLSKALLSNIARDPPYYEEKQEAFNSELLQALFGENTLLYDRYFQIPVALAILCLAFILLFPDSLKAWGKPAFKTGPLLLLFCIVEIKADEVVNPAEIYKARSYADAKMYDQARSLYEGLLLMPLSEQQKAALQYNIGTLYLEEGLWDQAIRLLNEIASKKNLQSFLYRKIDTNLTIAQYEKGLQMGKKDPAEALKQLHEALKTSKKLPDKELQKLKMAIKGKILKLHEESDGEKALKENGIDQIQKLYNGVSDALEALHFLEDQEMSNQLKADYASLFAEQQKQWMPLWEKSQAVPQFAKAMDTYKEFITNTSNVQISKAIRSGESIQATLSSIMDLMSKDSLMQEKLRQLLNGFQRLLAKKNWRNKPWKPLQELFDVVKKVEGLNTISFEINRSQLELTQAIDFFQKGNFPLAQLFAQDAAQWIKIASTKTEPITGKNLLQAMIQQVEYLIEVGRRLLENKSDKEITILLQPLLLNGQKALKPLEDLLYATFYQEQVEAYSKQGLCQAIPWGEALPLIDMGNHAVDSAEVILTNAEKNMNLDLSQLSLLQKSAIVLWQKALTEINHPTVQSSSCLGDGSAGGSAVSASNESLRDLLQMETQDRPPQIPSSYQKTVLHPW